MPSPRITPPHTRYRSYFVTTHRNILVYWIANMVIIPVYLTCIYIIARDLPANINSIVRDISNPGFINGVSCLVQDTIAGYLATISFQDFDLFPGFATQHCLSINSFEIALTRFLRAIILITALLPLLSLAFTPRYLRLGLKGRQLVSVVSIPLMLFLLHPPQTQKILNLPIADIAGPSLFPPPTSNLDILLNNIEPLTCLQNCSSYAPLDGSLTSTDMIHLITTLWFLLGLAYFLFLSKHRFRLLVISFSFVGTVVYLIVPGNVSWFTQASSKIIAIELLALKVIIGLLTTLLFWRLYKERPKPIHSQVNLYALLRFFVLLTAIVGLYDLWLDLRVSQLVLAIAGLLVLFLAAGPRNFVSRQVAHFRMLTRAIRHDYLYNQSSPLFHPQHIVNLLLYNWMPRYLSINNRKLFFSLALIVGGIIIPVLFHQSRTNQKPPATTTPLELLALGITSSIVLLTIYTLLWLIRNSSRFIVSEFDRKGNDTPELQTIAKLATYILVDELQRISKLLKLRQIENLHANGEENDIYFVTSGFDEDFINEIQQSVHLDMPNFGKISINNLLAVGLRLLARIHVNGTVQLRSNDSVQIWVELNYRNNRRAAVDLVILPENSHEEIDDVVMRRYAQEIAIKLFLKLGQIAHLGTSWTSLEAFLSGLEASTQRNWWQAISFYRKAIQEEETRNSTFGIGYYHLGAALVFQGEWDEGVLHLRTAETDGPVMAETKYMLAMVLLHKHWSDLQKHPNIFEEIDGYLAQALALRSRFPEAHHLRGKLYYRRGELEERSRTRNYGTNQQRISTQRHHYERAARFFAQALNGYDRIYRRSQVSRNQYEDADNEADVLIRQRTTAAHQRADALRVVGRYSEADSYYQDVFAVYPRTIRNLADITKTYCLAGNWQRAEEFLRQVAFTHNTAFWNADTNFHMGWALAGGVNARVPGINRLIERMYWQDDTAGETQATPTQSPLGDAMQHMDYALHQRPRYITSWQQTDWDTPFSQMFSSNISSKESRNWKWSLTMCFDPKEMVVAHYRLWLALRMDGLISNSSEHHVNNIWDQREEWKNDVDCFFQRLEEICVKHHNHRVLRTYRETYCEIKKFRAEVKELISELEQQKMAGGLRFTLWRLKLAKGLYEQWKKANEDFDKVYSLVGSPNFAVRWAIDVYSETALLTCRLLAEAEAYEILHDVASQTSEDLEIWVEHWKSKFEKVHPNGTRSDFTFAPRVAAFQRSTLYAWKAYANYQCQFDFLTRARTKKTIDSSDSSANDKEALDSIEEDLRNARRDLYYLPLVLFVQAQVFNVRGMQASAIEEYERLLGLIEPYDPKRHVGANQFQDYSAEPTSDDERAWMYYMEKVSGREQFSWVVNATQIHVHLADIYRDIGKPELRVQHLMEAIRRSPYHDLDVDNFLRLADQLNGMEQYQSAEAIIEAIRLPSNELQSIELSYTKRRSPEVMGCLIDTRRNSYATAIQNGRLLAQEFTIHTAADYCNAIDTQIKALKEKQNSNDSQLDVQRQREIEHLETLKQRFTFAADLFDTVKQPNILNKEPDPDNLNYILEQVWDFLSLPQEEDSKSSLHELLEWTGVLPKGRTKIELTQVLELALVHYDEYAIFVPQIFTNIRENQASLATMAQLAPYSLNSKALARLLNPDSKSEEDNIDFDKVMLSHTVYFLARQAMATLSQLAELCNSLAYSRTASGVQLKYVYQDSTCAVIIMNYLMRWADHGSPRRRAMALKFAQLCDTYGWVYYRDRLEDLESDELHETEALRQLRSDYGNRLLRAEHFLKEGVRYDQNRSIIHYHLARLYLTHVEMIWQENPEEVIQSKVNDRATEIDIYITEAFRQWRAAKETDTFDRLHGQLAWLYSRISDYKSAWEKRQYRGIAGDSKAELRLSRPASQADEK